MLTCRQAHGSAPSAGRTCGCGETSVAIVTVLFADLVGYTTLSETRDPEQVKNLIDGCFERLVADIDAFGGRVDKIIGDAIVALFGAPTAHEDDAERAVRAALRMQETLGRAHRRARRRHPHARRREHRRGARRRAARRRRLHRDGRRREHRQPPAGAPPSRVRCSWARPPSPPPVAPSATTRSSRSTPRAARSSCPPGGPTAPWRRPGYRPERNRARLIGREPELGLLCHSVENAICNAAGVAAAPARRGRRRASPGWPRSWPATPRSTHNALILEGRCVPYGEANIWWPVADALRHGAGIRSSDPADKAIELARTSVCIALGEDATSAEVDRVHQGLLYLMGYESELRAIDPARAREEATSAVVTYAERFSAHRPVVVVLSDLHWADDLVLELVDTLLDRLSSRKFVVLATARQAVEERWHPPHGRHNLVVLTLDPLTSDSAEALLCELAGADLGAGLAKELLDRSGGNPFFLEELVTLLSDAGMVGVPGHADHEDHIDLPDTLRGLVAARLDGLTVDERRVLDDCAVLGRRGPMMAIEVMAGKHLGIDNVRPILESLEAKELLVLSGTGEGEKWTFRSDLVREVAYSTLTKADRARSHFGIAVVDGGARGHRPRRGRRPHHLPLRARRGAPQRARPGRRPARRPHRAGAALARAGGRPRQPRRDRRWWPSASTARGSGCSAASTARGTAPSSRAGPVRWPGCASSRRRAPMPLAAVEESRQGGDDARRDLGRALLVLADIEQKASSWAASEDALDEAGRVFASLGDASGEAEVLRFRGFGALTRHEYAAATALLEQALARYEELDDRRGVAWVRQNLAWCAFYSGRAEEAEVLLHKAAATFEEIGDQGGLRWARGLLAWARFQQGHSAEAGEMAEAILADDRRIGDRWAIGMMLILAGSVRLWTGPHRSAPSSGCARPGRSSTRSTTTSGTRSRRRCSAGPWSSPVRSTRGSRWSRRWVAPTARRSASASSSCRSWPAWPPPCRWATSSAASRCSRSSRPGPVDGEDGELIVGDTERTTSVGLHRLQSGDVAGRGRRARLAGRAARSPRSTRTSTSALALAHVADGSIDEALAGGRRRWTPTTGPATSTGSPPASPAAWRCRGGATWPRPPPPSIRCGRPPMPPRTACRRRSCAWPTPPPRRRAAMPTPRARLAEAERRLAELGISDTSWRQAFALAVGVPRSTALVAQDGLLDHPQVGLLGVPAVGELRLGVLVGDRRHDDHVLALLPVDGVATLCLAVSCSESITRSSSSKLRPVDAG